MNNLKSKLNNLNRILEAKQTSFYTVTFLVVLLLIFFGLYPFYKVISKKIAVIDELSVVNTNLKSKRDLLINIPAELTDTQIYLTQLRTAIPSSILLQDYLVRMSEVALGSGYQQQRITLLETYENEAVVSVRFFGVLETFPTLVQKIEAMDRLTEIRKIDLTLNDGQVTIDMELKVFYLI